jgi:hypothetical protein
MTLIGESIVSRFNGVESPIGVDMIRQLQGISYLSQEDLKPQT